MGGKWRQAAAFIVFAMLLAPALTLILTSQSEVVKASPDTFGYDTPGTAGWQDVEDNITGSWFTPSSSGTVTSITAYVEAPYGPPKYRFGIHDKSDNSLVGYTEEAVGPASDDWLTLDIVSGGSITGGENYWLEVWGEGESQSVAYDVEVGKGGYDEETYGAFPDPWVPISEDRKYSIYATYTLAGAIFPTQPQLYLPADGSNVFDTTPYFEWENAENADNHRLLVDASPPDWAGNAIDVTVTENNYTPTSPLAEDNYSFKVVAQNENGENSSVVWTFNVIITYPTQPVLYLPSDGGDFTDNTPYFEWSLCENTENYRLLVDDDNDFSSPKENRIFTTENYYFSTLENSLPDDNYSWKVIAKNENGENSSNVWTFVVDGWLVPSSVYGKCGEEGITPATNTIDNNTGTYWNHEESEYHWITFDMGKTYSILKIRIYQGTTGIWGGNQGLTVYCSDNVDNWGDNVWEGILDAAGWQESGTFEKGGRYIRLVSKDDSIVQKMHEFNACARPTAAFVTTENATNIEVDNATLNATIEYNYQNAVQIEFDYKSDYQCYTEGENENWSLSDHYYDAPTDPATAGDWGNRTPVKYVAASDSSQEDKDFVTAQGENGWQCDGEDDHVEIQAAIDAAEPVDGKVYLFDGTYNMTSYLKLKSDISLVGENQENTIIKNTGTGTSGMRILYHEAIIEGINDILIENLTLIGPGRMSATEAHGIFITSGKNIVIKNVLIKDVAVLGIYFEVSGLPPETNANCWIMDSEIRNTGQGGIVFAKHHDGVRISEHNYILNNTIVEVGMGSPSYGGGPSIGLYSQKHTVVANNIIENSGSRAILISHGGYTVNHASENILVQGNRAHRNPLLYKTLVAIYISGGENESGDNHLTFDVVVRGNDINQFYGIYTEERTENCIIENNSFYNTVVQFKQIAGSGHTIENNVDALIENSTSWVGTAAENYSENVGNLYTASFYGFRAKIKYNGYENIGDWVTFETTGVGQPQLFAPENNDELSVGDITFEWTNGAEAAYHRLIVNNNQEFGGDNEIDLNFAVPENTHTGLLSAGQYWWKVVAVYGESENESAVWKFTLKSAPNAPTSLLCEGQTNPTQIIDLTPEFSAIGIDNDNDQMNYYALQVDDDSDFSSVFWDNTKTSITAFDNGTRCENITYAGSSLTRGVTYYWRIKFWDNENLEGAWSIETATFKIMQYPTQPILYLPSDGSTITDNTPTFEWSCGEHVSYHRLLVDNDPDFSSPNENRIIPPPADNVYTIADENALPVDNYSWKVIAINEVGENESDVWTFIVSSIANVAPNAPTSLLCAGIPNPTIIVGTPWLDAICTDNNDKDTLTHCAIQVDDDSGFGSLLWNSGKFDIVDFIEGDRSPLAWYGGSSLARGITYYWRIRFWDIGGAEGAWSTETATFKVNQLPTQPASWTDLGLHLIDYTPTITWTKGTDADGHTVTTYIYVGITSAPTTEEIHTTGETCDLGNVVTLSDGVTYYYRLRSWDGYEWSTYTTSDEFRMNSEPTVSPAVTPTAPLTTEDLTCDPNGYDAEGDAITFDYQWYENGTPISGQISNVLDSSQTEIGSKYKCRIIPNDGYEYGSAEDSNEVTVRLVNTAPVTSNPKCEGLTNPTAVATSTPTFSWTYSDTDGDPQSHWQIYVGTTSGASDMWDSEIQSGAFTSDVYGGSMLVDETTYYWQVRTKDGYDWSEWTTGTFKTAFVAEPTEGRYLLIKASADAAVVDWMPTYNAGAWQVLTCHVWPTGYAYLMFNLRELENYRVLKVELGLITEHSTNVPVVEIWTASNDWTEMGITWNNKPSLIEQVSTMEWSAGDELVKYKKYYADVTGAIEYALAHDQFEITFVLVPQGEMGQLVTFFSREAGEFHTLEALYELRVPLIPAVAVAFIFTLSLVGIFTWLYIKIRDVRDLSTAGWAVACVFIALLSLIITWGIASAFL